MGIRELDNSAAVANLLAARAYVFQAGVVFPKIAKLEGNGRGEGGAKSNALRIERAFGLEGHAVLNQRRTIDRQGKPIVNPDFRRYLAGTIAVNVTLIDDSLVIGHGHGMVACGQAHGEGNRQHLVAGFHRPDSPVIKRADIGHHPCLDSAERRL